MLLLLLLLLLHGMVALWRLRLGIRRDRCRRIERYLRIMWTLGWDSRIAGRRGEHGVGRLLEGRITGGVGVHGHYPAFDRYAVLLLPTVPSVLLAVRIGMPVRTRLGSSLIDLTRGKVHRTGPRGRVSRGWDSEAGSDGWLCSVKNEVKKSLGWNLGRPGRAAGEPFVSRSRDESAGRQRAMIGSDATVDIRRYLKAIDLRDRVTE